MPLEGTISPAGIEATDGPDGETSRCFVLRSDDGGDNSKIAHKQSAWLLIGVQLSGDFYGP